MKKNKTENNIQQVKRFLLINSTVLWFLLVLITVLFTIAHYPKQSKISYSYRIGDIAKRDIKAPKDFFIEDTESTSLKKDEVTAASKMVYDLDANLIKKMMATATLPIRPRSPIRRPAEAVRTPTNTMETRMPKEKINDSTKALAVVFFSCCIIKPMTSGILDRWHGLSRIDRIPQINEPANASQMDCVNDA